MADDTLDRSISDFMPIPKASLPPAMTSMGSPLDNILKQRKADEAKSDAAAKGAEDEIKTERDDYAKFRKDNPYPVPKVQPWTQPPPPVDPVRAFGSWASSLGIIASVLTKAPLTSALNASASAMNAIRSNDLAAYKEAEDAWSKNTDLALKQTEWEAKGYEHALDLMKDDHALGQAYWKTVAASAENHAAMMLGDAGIIENQQNYQMALQKFHEEGTLNKEKLDEAKGLVEYRIATTKEAAAGLGLPPNTSLEKMPPQIQQAVASKIGQYKAAQEGRKTTESMGAEEAKSVEELVNSGMPRDQAIAVVSQAKSGESSDSYSPQAKEMLVKRYLASGGTQEPKFPYGKAGAKQRVDFYNAVADAEDKSGRDGGELPGEAASYKADASSLAKVSQYKNMVEQFESTAEGSAKLIRDYAKKGVGPSGVPMVDAWIQKGRRAGGNKDIVPFENAIDTFTTEYAKVMSGQTGGAASTDSATKKAEGLINSAMNAEQLNAALDLMSKEMQIRKSSLSGQEQQIKDQLKGIGKPSDSGDATDHSKLSDGELKKKLGIQ